MAEREYLVGVTARPDLKAERVVVAWGEWRAQKRRGIPGLRLFSPRWWRETKAASKELSAALEVLADAHRGHLWGMDAATTPERDDGLTAAEGRVGDALVSAWNEYARLPQQHPSEPGDFADAIHICQQLLVMRIARRHYPKGWPVKAAATTPEGDDG